MTPAALQVHERLESAAEQELSLLIEQARQRQRRRQARRALAGLVTSVVAAVAALAVSGAYSPAADLLDGGRPASATAAGCPASPARFVANGTFVATVLGRGPVRLAIGNVYLKARRRIVLGATDTPGWSAIEVIWVRQPGHAGTLAVRGARLYRRGSIAVQSSDSGPGSGALTLAPAAANTAPGGLQLYPGVVWVRSGGCYALTVSGRRLSERLVFAAQAR